MLKMLRKILLISIIAMFLGVFTFPVSNKVMAADLDLGSILDDEDEDENTKSNEANEKEQVNDSEEDEDDGENEKTDKEANADTSSEKDIPQTGVTEDIAIAFSIGACVIIAVFAYKKAVEYKI